MQFIASFAQLSEYGTLGGIADFENKKSDANKGLLATLIRA